MYQVQPAALYTIRSEQKKVSSNKNRYIHVCISIKRWNISKMAELGRRALLQSVARVE